MKSNLNGWNYRIIERENGSFVIYEVYYDDKGAIELLSSQEMAPYGESKEELQKDLNAMQKAFDKEVIHESDIPFEIN